MKKLIILPFLFISFLSFATNYYVKNGGSDAANGLSDATAWATPSKVTSSMSMFQPGDSILFKKGSTWTNALITIGRAGIAGRNIIISSYGSGAKPVLSAQSGMPVIYVTTSERGYWTINDLDLRATTPPGGQGQSLGIYFAYWLSDLGPVPGWEIKNCKFNCSILVSGPDTWVHHNVFAGDYNHSGYNKGGAIIVRGPEGDNCIIEYNTIYGWVDRAIWIMRGGSNPVIRYNTAYDIWGSTTTDHSGTGINIDGYGVAISGAKIYNNYVYNCTGLGTSLENAFGAEAYNNKFINCGWGGFSIYWYPEHQGEPSNVNIHHNIVRNGSWGVLVNVASYWTIANNVFIKDDIAGATSDRNALYVNSPSTYISNGIFANNIIAGTGYVHAVKLPDTKNIWTLFDYNIIQPVGTEVVNRGGTPLTLSQVQALGFMAHGSTADPKFVSPTSDWHLQSSSPAINAGTNMNYTRDFDGNTIGSTPDIGPYEYQGIVTQPVVPQYISSVIQGTAPSVIEMNYNTTLANIVPDASAFTVTVSSLMAAVNNVAISGSKVLLTLAAPVAAGNTVTVAYSKPSVNPLQSTSGGQALSIGPQPVTNNLIAVATPLFTGAAVQNTAPSVLEISYNMTLANIVPPASSFAVKVNSVAATVNSVSISGQKVLLNLSAPVTYGNSLTVAYTKPAVNPLQSTSGGQAASFSAQSVVNNVIQASATAPVYVSSAVQDATPSVIEMTYNLSLANIVPASSAFAVTINSAAVAINSVAISGSKVLLTISTPVIYGNAVTVAYTKPASNPLQTSQGGQAASITAQTVTNYIRAVPIYQSSAIQEATPAVIEMNYNFPLENIVPAVSAYSATVNSSVRTVSSVAISGTKVLVTLSGRVYKGDAVTISYYKPSVNPVQIASGGQAASISGMSVTNNTTTVATIPSYVGSAIQNAAPSVIEMNYNMTLANLVPAATAFTVTVNSTARSVNSVAVSGSKVLLTLASPVVYGNSITVAYTKPSVNPLQSVSGALVNGMAPQPVTNNVSSVSTSTLAYVSSVIQDATPSVLEMTYNLTLANIVPAASSFAVTVNSTARSVNAVTISGAKVLLTLSSPVAYGNVVTISYTKPSTNPLQTADGAQAPNLSAQNVLVYVRAVPAYQSSVIQDATPSLLEMSYDFPLQNIVPAASAFAVSVNSSARTINSVAISGTKVLLTLANQVSKGDAVTVAYTKPATNPIQISSGGQASSITPQPVTNNVTKVSVPAPVYVSSIIQNATPNILEMNYNLTLAGIIPAASSFYVTVNSVAAAVNSVAISGVKVILTLSGPVTYGNKITVAYTKPAINPLQTSQGGVAENLSAQAVTNYVNAVPSLTGAAIYGTAPAVVEMNYDFPLANIVPSTTAYNVLVNSASRAVSSVAISGTKVLLTLASPASTGNTITVSYTKPSVNPVQISSGGQAASVSNQAVINNIGLTATAKSLRGDDVNSYQGSVIQNGTPDIIEMKFGSALRTMAPEPSAFTVLVNSVPADVLSDSISGSKVLLMLARPVMHGDIVTLAYSKPAKNVLTTSGGQPVAQILPGPVENKISTAAIIYPNPAKNTLNISLKSASSGSLILRILDMGGRLCMEKDLGASQQNLKIPISLQPSVYVVYILSGSNVVHIQKLIVTK